MTCKDIENILKNAGINVYKPGEYEGTCKEPYCVVAPAGSFAFAGSNNHTGYSLVDVYAFVPVINYYKLAPLIEKIKNALGKDNRLRFTGNIEPLTIDDTRKCCTQTIEYQLLHRN